MLSESEWERRRVFGQRVQALRRRQAMSQHRLAEAAGLSRTYVGAIERGESTVRLDAIWKLADAMGCHPWELLAQEPLDPEGD